MSDTVETARVTKVQKPPMYTVVFLNDDYTPMVFVVHLLHTIFHKSLEEAQQIMLRVHREGAAKVGSYTCEVANHKADQAMGLAIFELNIRFRSSPNRLSERNGEGVSPPR